MSDASPCFDFADSGEYLYLRVQLLFCSWQFPDDFLYAWFLYLQESGLKKSFLLRILVHLFFAGMLCMCFLLPTALALLQGRSETHLDKNLVRSICANGAAFLFLLSALWRWLNDYGTVCPAGWLLDEKESRSLFVRDIAIIVVFADVAVSD